MKNPTAEFLNILACAGRLWQCPARGRLFDMGIGLLGVLLAFSLTVLTMAPTIGHISGGHFNPAGSVGFAAAGRFTRSLLPAYVIAQCAGAVVAALALYLMATDKSDATGVGSFAANGFGDHCPGKYGLSAALLTEVVMTVGFLKQPDF